MDSKNIDTLKYLCIQQGHVPYECQLDGRLIFGLIQDGKNPCIGCNVECEYAHKDISPELTNLLREGYKHHQKQNAKNIQRIQTRIEKSHQSPVKVIMNIDGGLHYITISVMDLIKERMYTKTFKDIHETIFKIPYICELYKVDKILIETNGCGMTIYNQIKNSTSVDVVPMWCTGLRL